MKTVFIICLNIQLFTYVQSYGSSCLDVPAVKTPDFKKIVGKWYLIADSSPYGVTPFENCGIATNKYNAKNHTLKIRSQHFNEKGETPITDWVGVVSTSPNNQKTIKLFAPQGISDLYVRIIDTDYTSYEIIYGCTSVNNEYPGTIIWIFSRFCHFQQDIYDEALAVLKRQGFTSTNWSLYQEPYCCKNTNVTKNN